METVIFWPAGSDDSTRVSRGRVRNVHAAPTTATRHPSDTCLASTLARITRHPVSGRSILFVNPMHTHGFVGMQREEAWPLIEELADHATQERFVYYHRWRVGDVLMWDERATMHRGAGDYRPDEPRVMLRTIVYPN